MRNNLRTANFQQKCRSDLVEVSASIDCVMLSKNQQTDMQLDLNLQYRILMEVMLCEEEFRCRAGSLHSSRKLYAPIIVRAVNMNQRKL